MACEFFTRFREYNSYTGIMHELSPIYYKQMKVILSHTIFNPMIITSILFYLPYVALAHWYNRDMLVTYDIHRYVPTLST